MWTSAKEAVWIQWTHAGAKLVSEFAAVLALFVVLFLFPFAWVCTVSHAAIARLSRKGLASYSFSLLSFAKVRVVNIPLSHNGLCALEDLGC
jgi:hypothetical protein